MVVPAVQQKPSFNKEVQSTVSNVFGLPSKQLPRPDLTGPSKHNTLSGTGRKLSKRELKKRMLVDKGVKPKAAKVNPKPAKPKAEVKLAEVITPEVNPKPEKVKTTATKFCRATYETKLKAAKARLAKTKSMRGNVSKVLTNQGPSTAQDLVTVQLKDMRKKSPTYKQLVDVVFNEAYQEEVFTERKKYPHTNIASGSGKFDWVVEPNGFGGKKESYIQVATIESIHAAKVKCNVTRNTSALVRSIGNVDYSLASRMVSRDEDKLETFDDVPWANPELSVEDKKSVQNDIVELEKSKVEDAAKQDALKTLDKLNSMEIKTLEKISDEVEVNVLDLKVVEAISGKVSDEQLDSIYNYTLVEARELTKEQLEYILQEGNQDSAYACLAELQNREDDSVESKTPTTGENVGVKQSTTGVSAEVAEVIQNRKPFPEIKPERTAMADRLLTEHFNQGNHSSKRSHLSYIKKELPENVTVKSVTKPINKPISPLSYKFGGHFDRRLLCSEVVPAKGAEAIWSQEVVDSAWRKDADHSEALAMSRNIPKSMGRRFKAFAKHLGDQLLSGYYDKYDSEKQLEKTLGSMEVFQPSNDVSASEEQAGLESWLASRAHEVGASPLTPVQYAYQAAITSRINKAMNNSRRRDDIVSYSMHQVPVATAPKISSDIYSVGSVLKGRLAKPVSRPVSLVKQKDLLKNKPLPNTSLASVKVEDFLDLRSEGTPQERVNWKRKLDNALGSKSFSKVNSLFKEHKLSASGILVPAFC